MNKVVLLIAAAVLLSACEQNDGLHYISATDRERIFYDVKLSCAVAIDKLTAEVKKHCPSEASP